MEEEKTISSGEELLELLKKPIEIKSETLGILNFKHIYNDDYLFIVKCLDDVMDQEIFCKQFLINQINDPILTLDDFNDVNVDEIYSILKRYIEVENLEEYFDFNSSNDIFTIFKEGMESYSKYINSSLSKAGNFISYFNFPKNLSTFLNKVNKIVKQERLIWQKWISTNRILFNQINRYRAFWDNFQTTYQIHSLDAQKCLKKYNWFISPNMGGAIVYDALKVCNDSYGHKQKRVNNIFINYFLDNDYEKLDMMVDKWSTNPLFKKRIKIIKDCVNIMKISGNNINYSNLVVPTLISQIDGIQTEFMKISIPVLSY